MMTLISFQHSIKYINVQMAPYLALTIAAGYMATDLHLLWFVAYLAIMMITCWRFITLTTTIYLFTHDMLIVSRGIVFKKVDCVALWQLKGMEIRHNALLKYLDVSHIQAGLEGPPADRIRIIGVDDRTMLKVLDLLKEGIDLNTAMWREHFKATTT